MNLKKPKVLVCVGTRPEIIRLSRIISKINEYFELLLVHTGQNYDYELSDIFFEQLEIPAPSLYLNSAGENAAETISKVIFNVDKIISAENPDAFVVLGDTNSALSVIAAKRRKIPIFHLEAGNRCKNYLVPEEINRKIVDHVSDVNLAYSEIARQNLLAEGLHSDFCIKIGSPLTEVISYYRKKISDSKILDHLSLAKNDYFVVSVHREENVDTDQNLLKIMKILQTISDTFSKRIIFSLHPRTKKRLERTRILVPSGVEQHKPFGYFDYLKLQESAICVLSDSGTISEESSILNFPAINLRNEQERHEALSEGAVMLTGLELGSVMCALDILKSQKRGVDRTIDAVSDYSSGAISEKFARILMSFIPYVNRNIWKKTF
jgi:UDP-N-acetylglucosamine 2-epimerase (non-hydrolysing)